MSGTDVTSSPLNVDVTGPREVFDKAQLRGNEWWFTVVIGDLLPEWGEGPNEDDAVADLANSVRHLHDELHGWPDAKLAPHLSHQRAFLCRLLDLPTTEEA